MTQRHGYGSQESTYGFGRKLRRQTALLETFAADLTTLAEQARSEQPVDAGFAEEIEAVRDLIRTCVDEARDWGATFRSQHRRDVERVENPRRSRRIEEAADVGRAVRDV